MWRKYNRNRVYTSREEALPRLTVEKPWKNREYNEVDEEDALEESGEMANVEIRAAPTEDKEEDEKWDGGHPEEGLGGEGDGENE